MTRPVRVAMWSGPRNISTALMRAWESRDDTFVIDEPLYAFYLNETGLDHPGREEVIRSQSTDWRTVVHELSAEIPNGKSIYYQKHMAHHLLPSVELDWLLDRAFRHAFLIRNPEAMLVSLAKVISQPRPEDTGLPQQEALFRHLENVTRIAPPVIDSRDVLENPHGMLTALCETLDVPFVESMLSWKLGPRSTDGVWEKYWYDNVKKSTGFSPPRDQQVQIPSRLESVLDICREHYDFLSEYRLSV